MATDGREVNQGDRSKEPDLNVLKRRYEELLDSHSVQINSWEREGEHSRRMLRLTLFFIGIIITGLSVGGLDTAKSTLFGETTCAVGSGPGCVTAPIVLYFGILTLIVSTTFFIRGATGGIVTGYPTDDSEASSEHDLRPLSEFESESEYLVSRIEELGVALEEQAKLHYSKKMNGAIGSVSLLFSLLSFLTLGYLIASDNPLPTTVSFYIGIPIVLLMVFYEWHAPDPSYPVELLKGKFSRGGED